MNQTYPCWFFKEDNQIVLLKQPYSFYYYPIIALAVGSIGILVATGIVIVILRRTVRKSQQASRVETIKPKSNSYISLIIKCFVQSYPPKMNSFLLFFETAQTWRNLGLGISGCCQLPWAAATMCGREAK